MNRLLMRFRVGARLGVSFGLLILVSIALVSSGVWALAQSKAAMDKIVLENINKIRLSSEMLDANMRVTSAMRELIIYQGTNRQSELLARIAAERGAYDKAKDEMFATPTSPEGQQIRDLITRHRVAARVINQSAIDAAVAGDASAARERIAEGDKENDAWQAAIESNVALQHRQAAEAYKTAGETVARGKKMMLTGAAIAVISSVMLAFFITRSLTAPLARAAALADAIADGQVNNQIVIDGADETSDMLRSMKRMQGRLNGVLDDQRKMAAAQSEGMTSYRMDEGAYPGAFGLLIHDTNELVARSNGLIDQIVGISKRYAVGDMSPQMPPLPGDQAAVTQAMDDTRSNLLAISAEIDLLVRAAAAGDFSKRGDSNRFDHGFKAMIDSLNTMFDVTDRSLSEISGLLSAIAAGDLTVRVNGEYSGVFARMRDAANASSEQLSTIVRGIQAGTDSIRVAATEVSEGSADLSRRTEQQAANLEETAASMEELTSTVSQNAQSALQANKLAEEAGEVASRGGVAIDEVVQRMSVIEQSSMKIAEITSVIDGIAFQTNILALNAAVEAARAGDQGRGFAVVATEVRTLAQRSAAAAKEIKGLIESSVEDVSRGALQVREAGSTMHEIVNRVKKVGSMIAEISAASQEQSAGISQVSQAVVQMDEVTQQNAALVEEATAAANSMEEQAIGLNRAVSVFRLSAKQGPHLSRVG